MSATLLKPLNYRLANEGDTMEVTNATVKLICDLEYLIGSECYNPNAYDGWTGVEGCSYRYPVYIYPNRQADDPVKVRGNVRCRIPDLSSELIPTMKYKFGTNHLFIGNGIVKILSELEKRYGLDFSELEEKRQEIK